MEFVGDIFSFEFWKQYLKKHFVGGVLSIIGLTYAFSKFLKGTHFVYKHTLRPSHCIEERYGDGWAIITDASDPVGEAYAIELSKYFNILVLCKNENKLNPAIVEASEKNGKKILGTFLDFQGSANSAFLRDIRGFCQDKQICMLVINNMVPNFGKDNSLISPEYLAERVAVPVQLARCLIPNMLRRPKRSCIISISNMQFKAKTPIEIAGASVKAFMEAFCKSMASEYKARIDVNHFEVGHLIENGKKGKYSINAKDAVNGHLMLLGYENTGCGNWRHEIQKIIKQKNI